MFNYESLIDPADFGLIADYIRRSPTEAILHVKDRALLAPLARELAPYFEANVPGVPEVIKKMLGDGSLKLSVQNGLPALDPKRVIDPATVPRSARCEVIYLPPCYIVHTPGLFEGKFLTPSVSEGQRQYEAITPAQEHLRKIKGPRHGL